MDTGVADEDFANKTGSGHSTLLPIRGRGPTNPMTASPGRPTLGPLRLVVWCRLHRMTTGLCSDAGTYQMMLQLQCQTLVSTFHVNPLVCGIANKLWLRFLASTWVFASAWPDEVLAQSETTDQEETKKYEAGEPRNINDERMVVVLFNFLKKTIPLSSTLMVLYFSLSCYSSTDPRHRHIGMDG